MSHQQAEELDFSVIVPTHQRPRLIEQCIQSLLAQNYPKERFEIIVVHDGQMKTSDPVLTMQFSGNAIKQFAIPKAGVSTARNAGALQAAGRWLAFTDDDCAPEAEWLGVLGKYLAAYPDTVVGGRTVNGLEGNAFAQASAILENYIYDFQYGGELQSTQKPYFAGKNLAVPKDQFWQIGGFDIAMVAAEDRDFCDRWQDSGRKLRYVPQARVRHNHDLNWITFIRQHYYYGRSNYQYHQLRIARGGQRNRIESHHFYTGLVAAPWQDRTGLVAIFLSLLLLISQAANAAGYFSALLSTSWRV